MLHGLFVSNLPLSTKKTPYADQAQTEQHNGKPVDSGILL